MADPRNYEVGYGKPPKASRFQKGQSGNPKGRPKGIQNTATLTQKLLAEQVKVTENGRERRMSMHEVLLRQMVRKAAKGDLRSVVMLLQLLNQVEAQPELEVDAPDVAEEDEARVHRAFLQMHADLLQTVGLEELSA